MKKLFVGYQETKKVANWKPCFVFAILTFILYANTLNHFFVLDDRTVLTQNKFTQQGIKGIPNIFKYDSFVGEIMQNANRYKETTTVEQVQEDIKIVTGGRYRPLSLATFALEIEFLGKPLSYPNAIDNSFDFIGNPFVSHFNNILLYLFTTCLLYLILCRLFNSSKFKIQSSRIQREDNSNQQINKSTNQQKWYLSFPFMVTLLFLCHPIHTEVVANIKGRDEIMTLLGALAALWFTIKYFDTNKIFHLFLSGTCLFLGLLSKENAITFLAVIPITIYYFIIDKGFKTLVKPLVKSMLPLIVAAAIFLIIRTSILGFKNTSEIIPDLLNNPFLNATKSETLATIFYSLFIYVKLLFIPHPLTWDYYPFHIEIVNWSNFTVILSLLFYLGITVYAIYGLIKCFTNKSTNPQIHKSTTIISYSIWFYLLPLSIVSNLFFPVGVFMSERFVFISSIGFCIFIAWIIYNYLSKFTQIHKSTNPQINKFTTYIPYFILIVILCLFSLKTINRNKAWKDNLTLFSTDIKTSKNSAKGNYAIGLELLGIITNPANENDIPQKTKLCEEAYQHLQYAIEMYPKHIDAIIDLGILCFECYRDAALTLHCFAMALQNNSSREDAIITGSKYILNNIPVFIQENQISSTPEEVIQSCEDLLKAMPNLWEAYYIQGMIYEKYLNNTEKANLYMAKSEEIKRITEKQ